MPEDFRGWVKCCRVYALPPFMYAFIFSEREDSSLVSILPHLNCAVIFFSLFVLFPPLSVPSKNEGKKSE